MLAGVDGQHVLCLFIFIVEPLGAYHFRGGHGSAHAASDDAIGQVADAGHGRQERPAV